MEKNKNFIQTEIIFPVEFYDVDSMRIVWHGNYVKYMEKARCALLDSVGFGYLEMEKSNFEFPVVDVKLRYLRSLRFGEKVKAQARLVEYENCIKIKYEFFSESTGELTTKAESTQMAVNLKTGETCFVCPEIFLNRVEAKLKEQQVS